MTGHKLHPQLSEFIFCLEHLEDIMRDYGENFWATKISRVKKIAKQSDGYCVELFIGFFGGAGSLNDLRLSASNSVNDLLREELGRAYGFAMSLKD